MKNKRIEELEDVIGFNVYDLIPNDKDDYDVADIVLTIGERNGLNDYDEAIDYIRYNPKIFDEYLNDGYLENCKSLLQMINFIYLCELTSYLLLNYKKEIQEIIDIKKGLDA